MKKDYQENEVPKHRKRGSKRPWKITWTYIGPPTYKKTNVKTGEVTYHLYEDDLIMNSFIQPWTQRYKSEKSAKQAFEAWEDGKMMTWKNKENWKAEITCDE